MIRSRLITHIKTGSLYRKRRERRQDKEKEKENENNKRNAHQEEGMQWKVTDDG